MYFFGPDRPSHSEEILCRALSDNPRVSFTVSPTRGRKGSCLKVVEINNPVLVLEMVGKSMRTENRKKGKEKKGKEKSVDITLHLGCDILNFTCYVNKNYTSVR